MTKASSSHNLTEEKNKKTFLTISQCHDSLTQGEIVIIFDIWSAVKLITYKIILVSSLYMLHELGAI